MSTDELVPHYRKPIGAAGEQVIEKMYVGHAPMTRALVDFLQPAATDVVLDVGCGGGLALSLLAERVKKAYGVDYSDLSVRKAAEFNRPAVDEGRVTVQRAEASALPFPDGTFSLVTAIETVYFWERIDACYREMFRVVLPGGRFALVCDSWRDGDRIVNQPEQMDALGLNLYSRDDFTTALKNAGFADVRFQELTDQRNLCVVAYKK